MDETFTAAVGRRTFEESARAAYDAAVRHYAGRPFRVASCRGRITAGIRRHRFVFVPA